MIAAADILTRDDGDHGLLRRPGCSDVVVVVILSSSSNRYFHVHYTWLSMRLDDHSSFIFVPISCFQQKQTTKPTQA